MHCNMHDVYLAKIAVDGGAGPKHSEGDEDKSKQEEAIDHVIFHNIS